MLCIVCWCQRFMSINNVKSIEDIKEKDEVCGGCEVVMFVGGQCIYYCCFIYFVLLSCVFNIYGLFKILDVVVEFDFY